MLVSVVKSSLLDNTKVRSRWSGLFGVLMVLASGCGKGKGTDIDLGTGTQSSTQTATGTKSTQTGSNTTTTSPQDSTGNPGASTPGVTSTFDPGILTSLDLGTGTGTGTGPGKNDRRDCAKIKWGDRLKEGAIISRGDVSGYIDSDGDGLVEEKLTDAGMCQMHLSGKRCGVMVYGRWG